MSKTALLFLLLFAIHAQASPAEAERIKRSHELAAETWGLKWKLAADPVEKEKLIAARPDPAATATELWRRIAPSLKEDWTIPYSAFFLDLTRNLTVVGADGNTGTAFTEERKRVLEAFAGNHTAKPGIAPFSIALAESGDPKSLPLLEKIMAENPDEATKGIAALGASMLLKNLGDAPEVMKKRLTYLRQAIIMAADQTVGDISVADIVTDELFVIRFLAKGRVAPDLGGADVAGRMIRLSELRGKTVVLLFWDAKSPETDKFIGLTNQMAVKYADKPVAIVGVTPEALDRIRELQGDGSIKWNNIIDPADKLAKEYRIAVRPAAFVISPAGKFEYIGLPGSFAEATVDALLQGDAPKQ
jgi:peroxiredoxin